MPRAVVLAAEAGAAIAAAAAAASPREFVGLLAGRRGHTAWFVDHAAPLPNVARADDGFEVEPAAFAAAEAQVRARHCTWLGFVHSHPRGDASPSLTDRRQLWRECVQLIVAGDGRGPGAMRAYWLRGDCVEPLPLEHEANVCQERRCQERT